MAVLIRLFNQGQLTTRSIVHLKIVSRAIALSRSPEVHAAMSHPVFTDPIHFFALRWEVRKVDVSLWC